MANTLTNLTPDLYAALDVVSRELVGLVPSVSRDSGVERAALNQTVRSFVAPASVSYDVAPGQLPADNGDQSIGNKSISITKSKYIPIRWNGEEQRGMNSGPGYNLILQDQFKQAFRKLANEIEVDLAGLFAKASRAVAPAGTNLFDAANYLDAANVAKELNINGAPMEDRSLVLSNAAAARFKGNATYTAANSAGSVEMLRQGVLLDQFGMMIRESNQIQVDAAGDASSATTDNAGYSIGDTVITLASAGTGAILAGDTVSFAGDANLYVVESGDADVSGGGTITLAAPGLKVAMSAATKAITVNASVERNMAFSRDAIHLVTRAPARPVEGDSAEDVMIIQDPRSGLAFEVAMYKEYRQVKFEISIAWGYEMIKPEHCVLLID